MFTYHVKTPAQHRFLIVEGEGPIPGTVKLREGSLTALPGSSVARAPGAAPGAWAWLRRYAGRPPHQCEGRAEAAGGGDGHPL